MYVPTVIPLYIVPSSFLRSTIAETASSSDSPLMTNLKASETASHPRAERMDSALEQAVLLDTALLLRQQGFKLLYKLIITP